MRNNNKERDVEGDAKSSPVSFPTPKYIFTIYAPNVVTISEDEQKEWDDEEGQGQAAGGSGKNNSNKTRGGGGRGGGTKNKSTSVKAMWRKTILAEHGSTTTTTAGASSRAGGDPTTSSSTTKKKYKNLRVKMHSLVVKMVNRLVRDGIIQRESVQYVPSAAYVTILILISPSVLPVLMRKCEYLGIGCLAGQCFAVPLETSAVPEPKPTTTATTEDCIVIDDSKKKPKKKETGAETGASGGGGGGGGGFAGLITRTFSKEEDEPENNNNKAEGGDDDEDDDDADELSSVEYEDDNSDMNLKSSERGDGKTTTSAAEMTVDSTSIGVPSTIGVPLLGEKRIRELKNHIIKAREEWIATSSQVRVDQVIEEVTANAAFTVDYVAFVFCAATIAAVGLIVNSAASVLASMLVSPIMGPCMGMTFGTTVRKKTLVLRSARNELMSLIICLLVGAFWGVIIGVGDYPHHAHESSGWPSSEMVSRGQWLNLLTGILIALPSGVATALSVLGKNSSGLVGVAISLSLLPPAVNAGICWFYDIMLKSGVATRTPDDDSNYTQLGGVSFALTVVNIACIWIAGVTTFWLKEVSPYSKKNTFWKRDLKEYRKSTTGKADINKINEGIKAAIELREAEGPDVHNVDTDFHLNPRKVAEARRRGLAKNAMEDAFFMDTDFGLDGVIVPGGAAQDALPDDAVLENANPSSLVDNINRFGGNLEAAGEALFDDNLLSGIEASIPSDAGVIHADVANQILTQNLFN